VRVLVREHLVRILLTESDKVDWSGRCIPLGLVLAMLGIWGSLRV
jgi:hypothetical protein